MAKLQYLFIHCAATPPKLKLTPDHIKEWHMAPAPKGNGWSRVGYSDLILRDGELLNLSSYDQDNEVDYDEMTWGVAGKNSTSRHLCLEGGKSDEGGYENPLNRFTAIAQSLRTYIEYTILRHPDILVCGHYQFDDGKPFCPGFNVPQFLKNIGIPEKNIYTG